MQISLFADYVYFENSSSNPYLIRRIEELNKVRAQHCCLHLPAPRPWRGSIGPALLWVVRVFLPGFGCPSRRD
jgi:hypothetical protein